MPDPFDAATAELDPATGAAALEAAFAVAAEHGVEAHGIWTVAEQEQAWALGVGSAGAERRTDAFMKVICIAPSGRSGFAASSSVAAADLDANALAERAALKATAGGEPAELPPGEYPVVFEVDAVGWLCDLLAGCAFNGLAHAEGRGALDGRLGDAVAAPQINLADSPAHPRTLPRSFDAEGTPKAPIPLIQDGVAHGVAHDIRSAALAANGAVTTGHALAPGGDASGPHPTNLVLAGGGAADETELCAPIERGVYVTRLWYANVVRPKETLITAVTRDGTFLIEDGRVTRPLRDLRLTDSVLSILSRTRPSLASRGSRATASSTAAASRTEWSARRSARTRCASPALPAEARSNLQEDEHVHREQRREEDRPPVQVALHERSATEGARSGSDTERTGEPCILAGVQQHEHDDDDRENHLKSAEDCFHGPEDSSAGIPARVL